MTQLNLTTAVGQWVAERPNTAHVFESLRIDYCCGGNKPLAEACASAGVDVDNVMELLAEVTQSYSQAVGALDFQNASLPELIAHILNTHHVFTKSEMDRLQALVDKVLGAHGGNHPELIHLGELFMRLCADLKPHMFKEEQVLFPYITSMEEAVSEERAIPQPFFGTVQNPVRMMSIEHDTAGELLRELRRVTDNYRPPADACISYQTLYQALAAFETDLHQHIHLENNILFPRALEMESTAAPDRSHQADNYRCTGH